MRKRLSRQGHERSGTDVHDADREHFLEQIAGRGLCDHGELSLYGKTADRAPTDFKIEISDRGRKTLLQGRVDAHEPSIVFHYQVH